MERELRITRQRSEELHMQSCWTCMNMKHSGTLAPMHEPIRELCGWLFFFVWKRQLALWVPLYTGQVLSCCFTTHSGGAVQRPVKMFGDHFSIYGKFSGLLFFRWWFWKKKKKKHYSAKTHLPRENGEGINKLMLRKVGGI